VNTGWTWFSILLPLFGRWNGSQDRSASENWTWYNLIKYNKSINSMYIIWFYYNQLWVKVTSRKLWVTMEPTQWFDSIQQLLLRQSDFCLLSVALFLRANFLVNIVDLQELRRLRILQLLHSVWIQILNNKFTIGKVSWCLVLTWICEHWAAGVQCSNFEEISFSISRYWNWTNRISRGSPKFFATSCVYYFHQFVCQAYKL